MSDEKSGGSSRAERAYRLALAAYPSSWRRQRSEEMLGVLLARDSSSASARASWRELASLVRHGLAARVADGRRPGVWQVSSAAAAMVVSTTLAAIAVHELLDLGLQALLFGGGSQGSAYLDPLLPASLLWLVTFAALVVRRGRIATVGSLASVVAYGVVAANGTYTMPPPEDTALVTLGVAWDHLALLVPTVLVALLLLRPGHGRSALDAVGAGPVRLAFASGAAAGLLDVVGGISDAWPPLLVLGVLLGAMLLQGGQARAALLVALAFAYVPLSALTDGSGSRLPHDAVALGVTLALLPAVGALAVLAMVRLQVGVGSPRLKEFLAGTLERTAATLRG